ncbi:phospholipase [Stachybotrys elegans]|uniref:Phospholipase n=1 Tax=Stachybotrys elegans TaxID=80388 RepID=A0A8K0WMJ1_9HYPO|nr:phospholipase [Stachybotrys elegans]
MKPCKHTSWLSLQSRGERIELLVTDRVQKLVNVIPYGDDHKPSLVVLVGNATKTNALQELFGVRRARQLIRSRGSSELHLHVEPTSLFLGRPRLIIEGDITLGLKGRAPTYKCHETGRHKIERAVPGSSLDSVSNDIFRKLLFPFTDIFCLFCDDLGGFQQVAQHVAAWLEDDCQSVLPVNTRPRIILATDKFPTGINVQNPETVFLNFLKEATAKNIFDHVSAIDIVQLIPGRSRFDQLKKRLLTSSDVARASKEDAKALFSITHFAALLNNACVHFCKHQEPFDFIKSSRKDNPISSDLEQHLSRFLEYIKSPEQLMGFAAPIIASSLVLDSYPPDAHYFPPSRVFETLYVDILKKASKKGVMAFADSRDVVLRSGFLNKVKTHFEEYSQQPIGDLPCKHSICGNCAEIFGKPSNYDDSDFIIKRYFLCQSEPPEEVKIKIHPPTAGIGILCVDGGGVKGTIPLAIMRRIEERIDLPIQFQRFFKVAFGVSSGLPVATTDDRPTCRLFTNYNGVASSDLHRTFFPPKHIDGVGLLQDAGPLENDPLVSALFLVADIWPHIDKPDFVLSLGTGEPKLLETLAMEDSCSAPRNGMLPRLCRLFWEKTRDGKMRQLFQAQTWYHRLNVQFNGSEPRLDDVRAVPGMKSKVNEDSSLSAKVDNVIRYMIASLFYFELEAIPHRYGGRYLGSGHILCSVKAKDPAFPPLMERLKSSKFRIDGYADMQAVDDNCFDENGNFRKLVKLETEGRFAITLSEQTTEPCHISGSPLSVEKLVKLQGLSAVFGRSDHRKRKRSGSIDKPKRKRLRTA